MIDKKEVQKIKLAAKGCKTKNDTFFIKGRCFSCEWNGKNFTWIAPSGQIYEMDAKEVIKYIDDGLTIEEYIYDYNNPEEFEED